MHGAVGPVDDERDAQAVRVGGHLVEQGVGLLGGEAGRDDADVDAAGVHGDEELLQRGRGREVAAEELGDAFVARPGP